MTYLNVYQLYQSCHQNKKKHSQSFIIITDFKTIRIYYD